MTINKGIFLLNTFKNVYFFKNAAHFMHFKRVSQGIEKAFKFLFLINIIVATLVIKQSKAFRVVLTYLKICREYLDSSSHNTSYF